MQEKVILKKPHIYVKYIFKTMPWILKYALCSCDNKAMKIGLGPHFST